MKKITKTICTLLLCSLVLFLLLPFIFPNSGLKGTGKGSPDQQTVSEPQIFTSNPLTKLVQSLARIFKKEQAPSPVQNAEGQPLSEAQANARFGTVIGEDDYATQETATDNNEEEQTKEQRQENVNAYQNEEGEWVLIQQTTPKGGVSGMHEISVKDNAYERYAKYEREARFTPTPTKRTQTRDVPDSKLARLFQPIKKFFGFDEEVPTQTPALDQATAAKTGRTDGLGKDRNPDNFAKFTNPSMPNGMLPIGQTRDFGKNPVADLLNMVNPERTIQDAAEQVADSKYPDPKNPQEKAARQKLSNEKAAQYKQYFDDHLSQHLLQLAQGKPATDILDKVVEGCSLAKSAFISPECNPGLDTTDVQQTRLENQERFRQQVGKNLPNAPVMLVLSKADPLKLAEQLELLQGNEEDPAPQDKNAAEQKMTADKYQFMLANKNCTNQNPCYWVAGYVPPEVNPTETNPSEDNPANHPTPRLEETVTASGVQFAAYVNKNTVLLDRDFVQEQLDKLPPDATDETRQQTRTLAENTHTPYVLVDIEELRRIQQINKDVIKQGHQNGTDKNQIIQQGRAIFAESAPTAWQLSQDLGDPYIFYEENNSVVDAKENPTTKDRAQKLNDAMIASSVFVQKIVADIRRMANEESTYNAVKPMAQQIQKETDEKIKDFTKTGKVPVVSLP